MRWVSVAGKFYSLIYFPSLPVQVTTSTKVLWGNFIKFFQKERITSNSSFNLFKWQNDWKYFINLFWIWIMCPNWRLYTFQWFCTITDIRYNIQLLDVGKKEFNNVFLNLYISSISRSRFNTLMYAKSK